MLVPPVASSFPAGCILNAATASERWVLQTLVSFNPVLPSFQMVSTVFESKKSYLQAIDRRV
jgi:hypothetical protein